MVCTYFKYCLSQSCICSSPKNHFGDRKMLPETAPRVLQTGLEIIRGRVWGRLERPIAPQRPPIVVQDQLGDQKMLPETASRVLQTGLEILRERVWRRLETRALPLELRLENPRMCSDSRSRHAANCPPSINSSHVAYAWKTRLSIS